MKRKIKCIVFLLVVNIITIFLILCLREKYIANLNMSQMKIARYNYIRRNKNKNVNKNYINIPILYINLDRSVERKKYLEKQLDVLKLNYQRASAVDGKNLSHYTYVNNYTKLTDSEIGCSLSHLKAIKVAYDNDMDEVLIIEDDLEFSMLPFWSKNIKNLIKTAPKDWELLQLHTLSTNSICASMDNKFYKCDPKNLCYSTAAYIMNRKGIKKVVDKTFEKNKYYMGEIKNDKIFPTRGKADGFIFEFVNSYHYTTPLFLVSSELSSTILKGHDDNDNKSNNFNLNFYEKYNKINIPSDYLKQEIFSKVLYDFDDFMKENNIRYYLAMGTLLGAIREDKFIEYDHDIDVGVFYNEYNIDVENGNENFIFKKQIGDIKTGAEFCFEHKQTKVNVDIFITYTVVNDDESYTWTPTFYGKCDKAVNKMCRWKNYMFYLVNTDFIGREFLIPNDPVKYLEEHYGLNWNIPLQYNYHDGVSKNLYRGLIHTDFPEKDRNINYEKEYKKNDLYPKKIKKIKKPILWLYNKDSCNKSIITYFDKFYIIILDDDTVEQLSRTINKNFRNINDTGKEEYIKFVMISE